jgi:MinD-like ATPase involved in chromosome partitioning or flagellar assembly
LVPSQQIISFVSGKGGVGKTSLAANFAWICGRVHKTILVDLDFHNQGATGLFLSRLSPDVLGSFELLEKGDFSRFNPTQVEDSVFFVPAVTPFLPVDYSRVSKLLIHPGLAERLRDFAHYLMRDFSFDIVVLDCHGGLDSMSVAAYTNSNDTLVISEADTVAFNGTLELLDFYDTHAPTMVVTPAEAMMEGPQGQLTKQTAGHGPTHQLCQPGQISFVVNRLPSKYRFDDLDSTYKTLIANYNGDLTVRPSVLSFIPDESFLAESFGEYPFPIKLAPQSVVGRKLQLMMIDLLLCDLISNVSYSPLNKLHSARFREKVRAIVVSDESRNTNNIVSAFGWVTLGFPPIVITLILLFNRQMQVDLSPQLFARFRAREARCSGNEAQDLAQQFTSSTIAAEIQKEADKQYHTASRYEAIAREYKPIRVDFGMLLFVFLTLGVFCGYYILRAQLGLTLYYDQRYRFRKALTRTTGNASNMWQTLHLLRLSLMRVGSAVTFVITALLVLFYSVLGLLYYLDPTFLS